MLTKRDTDSLHRLAEQLCGRDVDDVTGGGSGRNSRIFRVHCGDLNYALKFYRPSGVGPCSRLDAESQALQFFERHGITSVPRLIATDRENNCSLLEWIDGKPILDVGTDEIEVASRFLGKLHTLRNVPDAANFLLGTEASLSGSEVLRQLKMRLTRLRKAAENHLPLREFIEKDFAPAIETIGSWSESSYASLGLDFSTEASRDLQTLSPVDFGFHNTLRRDDGTIIFLDFEYFGWADPVNLVSDTLLHPGMVLQDRLRKLFYKNMIELYGRNPHFLQRLKILYPLYGLRWCAIMLNRFLPGYMTLKTELSAKKDKRRLEEEQLNRVRNFTQEIYRSYKEFPYVD